MISTRREFLARAASTLALTAAGQTASASHRRCRARTGYFSPPQPVADSRRLLFTSQGKTGIVAADGSGLRYFDFKISGQATWQPALIFGDGRRVIFLSMEPRRDGPGRPFSQYYSQTPTHLWIHDLQTGALEEMCTKNRLAPFETPSLLVHDDRILVQVVRNMVGQIYSMRLDGSDAREFTQADEGMPYGFSLSPDGSRVAFHLAGREGYQVWTSDLEGKHRIRVAALPGHLYFGTSWSPDGQWVLFVDCRPAEEPGHDWADVCIGRADGSGHFAVTTGKAMWFAATYGDPKTRGGGSNLPAWTRNGEILFPRGIAGSEVAWKFQPGRPDVDHFNRDYHPELARGGTQICVLNPWTGRVDTLSESVPPVWDFRASQSMDGQSVAFCRAATGGAPALWVMNSDGSNPRLITRGIEERGVDHPRWIM
jgi:Tol biopolymer transport system component